MNKPFTAAEAKAHLSALLDRAASGQETIITRRGKPVARVAPLPAADMPERKPGALKGMLKYDNATLWAPMTEEELLEAEGDLDEFMAMTVEEPQAYSRELRAKARQTGRKRKSDNTPT